MINYVLGVVRKQFLIHLYILHILHLHRYHRCMRAPYTAPCYPRQFPRKTDQARGQEDTGELRRRRRQHHSRPRQRRPGRQQLAFWCRNLLYCTCCYVISQVGAGSRQTLFFHVFFTQTKKRNIHSKLIDFS